MGTGSVNEKRAGLLFGLQGQNVRPYRAALSKFQQAESRVWLHSLICW